MLVLHSTIFPAKKKGCAISRQATLSGVERGERHLVLLQLAPDGFGTHPAEEVERAALATATAAR